ncbi:MAG: hypothetical protein JW839_10340 [Candidatus Lokiarchaeota archaeon]|nr:hypothetical protein [Candidatus Lokiarchaeota archaeon]
MFHELKLKFHEFFTSTADDERFSKVENLIEGIAVYILIVVVIYRLALSANLILENVIRIILLIYMMIIGPWIHRNNAEELGIGNVKLIKEQFFNRKKPSVIIVVIILVVISIFVFPLIIDKFELVLKLVPGLSALNEIVADQAPWFKIPLAVLEYILFQVVIVLFVTRKDNLWTSLKSMWKPIIFLICVVFVMSLISLDLFHIEGTFLDFLAFWYGYTFWGIIQQLPFLVYLSARFRKGFPYTRASEWVNIILLAFFFGLFHAPQWTLVVVAFMMELFIAQSFIHDETRNLFIAGLVHGFFGTMAIFFTGIHIWMDFT